MEQVVRSLLLLEVVGEPERLVDVGSGAGLPGIPLAICLGGVTLIEPRARAAGFLERAVRDLGLDARVVAQTAEEAARGPLREAAEAVVARALGPPAVALELCAPLCAVGGRVVLTAGPGAAGVSRGQEPEALGVEPLSSRRLTGPLDIEQSVHIAQKVSATSSGYPRRPGRVRRRPVE